MATPLTKDLLRESTAKFDNRNICVTLSEDQKIKMKLKGMKSGEVSIGIRELYLQLCGCEDEEGSALVKESKSKPVSYSRKESLKYVQPDPKVAKTILNDLRSQNAISNLDVATLAKFDGIIVSLLNAYK
tara:strand:+ start:4342 stop:4731 length:390 start_codon:yes stop_codon:yes gene_type:complete